MYGWFMFSGIILAVFTVLLLLLKLPVISYALVIGILLLMGFLPFGPLGEILGIMLCVVSSSLMWGLGGALLAGGITINYFAASLRGPEALAWSGPRIIHSLAFQLITGPVAILAALVGMVILVIGVFT